MLATSSDVQPSFSQVSGSQSDIWRWQEVGSTPAPDHRFGDLRSRREGLTELRPQLLVLGVMDLMAVGAMETAAVLQSAL
jgi:hypothetical protein